MRIAALYDIHGNLPALEAVVAEIRNADVNEILVGGDVLPGPMPRETLSLLQSLDVPVRFIHGNGELAVLAQVAQSGSEDVRYWGTPTGAPPPPDVQRVLRWTAGEVASHAETLRSWPKTICLNVRGAGDVLFCHGTPDSETECFTRLTHERLVAPAFENINATIVVCGHTHMQFDRMVAGIRVVNAGSVGMPFGKSGAHWILVGPDIEFRRTIYDLQAAAERILKTEYPQAREFAEQNVLRRPSEERMLNALTSASFV